MTTTQKKKLTEKLQQLFEKVKLALSGLQMRKVLTGAALMLLTGSVQAQTFAPPVTDAFGIQTANRAIFPNLADMDDDGDLDLIYVKYDGATESASLEFLENSGDAQTADFSGTPVANPFGIDLTGINLDYSFEIDLADMDDDGDLDIVAGVYVVPDIGALYYFENTGTSMTPQFGAPEINPFGLGTTYYISNPVAADIDDDGDIDILVGEYYADIIFFENTGTAQMPAFAAGVKNPFGLDPSISGMDSYVFFDLADIDGDGDLDLLGTLLGYTGTLVFQENTGTPDAPAFAPPTSDTPLNFDTGAILLPLLEMGDLDDDGDIDVLADVYNASTYMATLHYFENITTMNAVNGLNEVAKIEIFPNPSDSDLNIKAEFEESIDEIITQVFDASGRQIYENQSDVKGTFFNLNLNVGSYPQGLYLIKIQADNRYSTYKFMKE